MQLCAINFKNALKIACGIRIKPALEFGTSPTIKCEISPVWGSNIHNLSCG